MIQKASEQDIPKILRLVEKVFPEHVIVKRGEDLLKEQIKNEEYIPFVARIQDRRIVGHGGVFIHDGIGFLQGLVVLPEFRGRGIGEELSRVRASYCLENQDINHIVLYSVMNHRVSQSFYDDSFIPIGLCIEPRNIFSDKDPFFQPKPSCEIALCMPKFNHKRAITTNSGSVLEAKIIGLYQSIGISIHNDAETKKDPIVPIFEDAQMVGVDISEPTAKSLIKGYLGGLYSYGHFT